MIKKIVFAAVLTAMMLVGCNRQIVDFTYSYNYAIIKMPDGSIVEGKVQSWADYEGEQLQIVIDGNTYLANSVNVVMMTNAPEGRWRQ